MGVITIEMKTSFMRPARPLPGQHLVAQGLLLHRTKTMAFTDGKVFDATGALCAHSTGTFKFAPRKAKISSTISTD
jgi:acyl-coenzyme A thioesterase PaaI-like protein